MLNFCFCLFSVVLRIDPCVQGKHLPTELCIQVLNPFLCCCPSLGKIWVLLSMTHSWGPVGLHNDNIKADEGPYFPKNLGVYILLAFLASSEETHFTDRTVRTRKLGDRAAGHMSCDRVIETSQHIFKGQ